MTRWASFGIDRFQGNSSDTILWNTLFDISTIFDHPASFLEKVQFSFKPYAPLLCGVHLHFQIPHVPEEPVVRF